MRRDGIIVCVCACGGLAGCGNQSSPPHLVTLAPGGAGALTGHRAGTFIGSLQSNRYGPVRVQITVDGAGHLAIAAQSAAIDTVSGAT